MMDPRELIQHFVESMTQLMALMRQEIEMVHTKRFEHIEQIQRHKVKLTKAFEAHQTALRKDTSAVAALSDDERSELRALYQAFRETLSENMLALKAAQDTADRVVKMIINGVRKSRGLPEETVKTTRGPAPRGYGAYSAAGSAGKLMSRSL